MELAGSNLSAYLMIGTLAALVLVPFFMGSTWLLALALRT